MARRSVITTDQILDAARALFLERGADVPTAEIARHAGVSEGSIFRRFPTKQDLFLAAMGLDGDPPWVAELEGLDVDDPRAALRHVALTLIDYFSSTLPCMMLLWSSREVNPHQVVGSQPKRSIDALIGFFDRLMHQGKLRFAHPEIATRAFVGSLTHYVFFEKMVGMHQLSAESYTDGLVDLFMRGLAPSASEVSQKKVAEG